MARVLNVNYDVKNEYKFPPFLRPQGRKTRLRKLEVQTVEREIEGETLLYDQEMQKPHLNVLCVSPSQFMEKINLLEK